MHADDPELHDAVRRHLWPGAFVLGAHGAWELLARLTPDPQGEIRKALALDGLIAAAPWGAEDWTHLVADHQGLVADIAIAHLVAGDAAAAVELVTVAPGVDDRALVVEQVVKAAIRLGRPTPQMLRWLDEDPSLEALRAPLLRALEHFTPAAPVPSPAPGPVGPLGPVPGQPASRLVSVTRSSPGP